MLLLLLCLSALGLVSDAAPVSASTAATISLTSCPITYFGKQFDSLFAAVDPIINIPFLRFDDRQEQVVLPEASSLDFQYELLDDAGISSIAATVETNIPALTSPALCGVKITVTLHTGSMDVYFLSYGDQAAVYFDGTASDGDKFTFTAGNAPIDDRELVATNDGAFTQSVDITGCRDGAGAVYLPDAEMSDTTTCTRGTCLSTGVYDSVSDCTSSQVCDRFGSCLDKSSCSIVGSSVLDFNTKPGTVGDFCTYTVLDSGSDFKVVAHFGERQLKDVPFINRAVVKISETEISLGSGNTVKLDGDEVTDLDAVELPEGVSITRDDEGVVLTYEDSLAVETSLFYDGTLLHITHLVPPSTPSYSSGLCADITKDTADSKDTDESPEGCETVNDDPLGDGIDCDVVETRCSDLFLFLGSTFVSSTPFVTACADNMLCKYPDVDGIACHFLDAFARTNGLSTPRETSGCAVPLCVGHYCADHEYCTEDNEEAICKCRPLNETLNAYRTDKKYGGVATCDADSVSITLIGCLVEEANVVLETLHQKDSSCTGTLNKDHTATYTSDSANPCGREFEDDGTAVEHSNRIQNTFSSTISFENVFELDYRCKYLQPTSPKTISLSVLSGSKLATYDPVDVPYTLSLALYTDDEYTTVLADNAEVDLDELLYAQVKAEDIDADALSLKIDKCWTTTEELDPNDDSSDGVNPYTLITDGCATGENVEVVYSGTALDVKFKFRTYVVLDDPDAGMHLHCKVSLCIIADGNCAPDCTP